MIPVPCERNARLGQIIREYAQALASEAHTLGGHGLTRE